MATDRRVDRLRASVLACSPAAVRAAVGRIPETTIRALPAQSRPLVNALKRSADPATLLRRTPDRQVALLLADVLSDDCLDAIRELLGDAADDPTREQLLVALDAVLADFDVATVRVTLNMVAVADAKAADLCDAVLVEDERFALDVAPVTQTARPPKPPASDEVRTRRRARREAASKSCGDAPAPSRRRKKTERPLPSPPEPTCCDVPATTRRAAVLTPQQARRYDATHVLVGAVVLAEVRFDGVDPAHPHLDRKHRPCVVVGVAKGSLLVRPGYSEGGLQSRKWQSYQLRDWQEAGLDRPSWIETKPHVVARHTTHHELGRLSDGDWNALW